MNTKSLAAQPELYQKLLVLVDGRGVQLLAWNQALNSPHPETNEVICLSLTRINAFGVQEETLRSIGADSGLTGRKTHLRSNGKINRYRLGFDWKENL